MRSHKPLWGPIIWAQRTHIQERSSIQADEKTEENILDAKRSSKLWFRNIPVFVTNYNWEDISDRVWICIEIRWWWHPVATYQSTLIILLKTYQSKWFILFNRVCNKLRPCIHCHFPPHRYCLTGLIILLEKLTRASEAVCNKPHNHTTTSHQTAAVHTSDLIAFFLLLLHIVLQVWSSCWTQCNEPYQTLLVILVKHLMYIVLPVWRLMIVV